MKDRYSQNELDKLLSDASTRQGWDFSVMKTERQAVPWDYLEEVKKYLNPSDSVLDIGTGGGERFMLLAPHFKYGLATDIDPEMINTARTNATNTRNVEVMVSDKKLDNIDGHFQVITNRHAPFDLTAVKDHLHEDGYFITQQVGEKNMSNIKSVLGREQDQSPISEAMVIESGLTCLVVREYDVEYVVKDIESLIFWLSALDMLHSDLSGQEALADVDTLNAILKGNVGDRGFVTNEHRYLAVAHNSA